MLWAYVALGSALGGVTRWWLGGLIQNWAGPGFPAGTLLINISGSFLLGLLMSFSLETPEITPEVRLLLTTGFCGGYTTFSTFSYDAVRLVQEGEWSRAVGYAGLSLFVSLAACAVGIGVGRSLIALRRGS